MRHIVIHPNFSHLLTQLEKIETLFNNSHNSIHKARNELRVITLDNTKMVIKAFRIPNLVNQVVYAHFRDSKASKSYHNALQLLERDIPTPEPVAYIEDINGGLFKTSYFISLFEPYDFTIREAFHHKVEDYETVIKAFVAFTYSLHLKGVWHEDYSLGNILITRQEQGYRFSLVDINRMKFRAITPQQGCENFSKLWAQDEDLLIMAQEYARLSGISENEAINLINFYVKQVIDKKAFKKKLKKLT